MTNTKINTTSLLVLSVLFILAIASMSYAITFIPSAPNSITYVSTTNSSYPNGRVLNMSRANIYTYILDESQPTIKWTGIVGNITAEFALQDATGNALYDWTIYTTTGEVYATKETTGGAAWDGGGVPLWTAVQCANSSDIEDEGLAFNSTYWGNSTKLYAEDSYINTFKDYTLTWPTIYVGERLVRDYATGAGAGEGCRAINLNENNTVDTDGNWLEVVLTDNQTETEVSWPAGSNGGAQQRNLIYMSIIENNSFGYNGQNYDFQMILPQQGFKGDVAIVPFYFYVELV